MEEVSFESALNYVKQKHEGQLRAGNTPVWHHLARVSDLLDSVLQKHREGDDENRRIIPVAALGHDLFEDTDASKDEVREIFGGRGFELIWGMTNEWGDKNTGPYIEKVAGAEEAIRLIKLADLCDNIAHVTYTFSMLGEKWISSFFLPIVTPMREKIIKTKFKIYARSAEDLISALSLTSYLLTKEQERFKQTQP